MSVALITEGTYPHHRGGVSVWCDQLIRGLPDVDFDIHAMVATESDTLAWELPGNVRSLRVIPLWGFVGRPRRTNRAQRAEFEDAFEQMLSVLLDPKGKSVQLIEALRSLVTYSRHADLAAAMRSETAAKTLARLWFSEATRSRAVAEASEPTLADVVRVCDHLEHCFRPLSFPDVDADISHTVANGLGALVGLATKWQHGTPFLLTEHGVYLRERYLSFRQAKFSQPVRALLLRFFRMLTAAGYEDCDILAPSNRYNLRWELQNGADASRIRIIPNGVDPSAFPVAPEPSEPVVSWVGRVDPLKGLETLIRAFAKVNAEIPEARLRMFGATPQGNEWYHTRCDQLIEAHGLLGIATFEGVVPDAVAGYHAGQIVALTSISEGLPFSVIEAMMTGRPVVATDVGAVREAVGEGGVVVPSGDVSGIAEACIRLLTKRKLRERLGVAAHEHALANYQLDDGIREYAAAYADLRAATDGTTR
jgi:glycosyltransferase involved in cell wall biosynthesis